MTNTLITDILGDFDLGDVELNSEDLYNSSNTLSLSRGETVATQATIGGNKIDIQITLNSARLTRVSALRNNYQDPARASENYLQVTGVMTPVDMNIDVDYGGKWISLTEFLCNIYNGKAGPTNQLEPAAFAARLKGLGFRYDGGATLMWHHFGVDEADFAEIVKTLRSHGAQDDLASIPEHRRGRIEQVWKFPEDSGLEITGIEVTSQDRSVSNKGQGFTNFVESAVESFLRTIQLKWRQAQATEAKQAAQAAGDEAEAAIQDKLVTWLIKQSTAWSSNLSGAQQRKFYDPASGEISNIGSPDESPSAIKIDPVNAPIGRITYVKSVDAEGVSQTATLDFWRQKSKAPALPVVNMDASAAAELPVAQAAEADEDETPY